MCEPLEVFTIIAYPDSTYSAKVENGKTVLLFDDTNDLLDWLDIKTLGNMFTPGYCDDSQYPVLKAEVILVPNHWTEKQFIEMFKSEEKSKTNFLED